MAGYPSGSVGEAFNDCKRLVTGVFYISTLANSVILSNYIHTYVNKMVACPNGSTEKAKICTKQIHKEQPTFMLSLEEVNAKICQEQFI